MAGIALIYSVKADADTVYRAVSTAVGIAGWFTDGAEVDGDIQRLTFPGQPAPWEWRVTEADAGRRLALKVLAGPEDWVGTEVVYAVEVTDEGSVLRFDHNGFPAADDHFRHTAATWAALFPVLQKYAETGEPTPFFTN
ncbi:SRPBCC family protein [Streptomyces sp. NPDC001970]